VARDQRQTKTRAIRLVGNEDQAKPYETTNRTAYFAVETALETKPW